MPIVVTDTGNGDFERPEVGLQQAVCSHVLDLGMQETSFGQKHKIALVFELAQQTKEGKPFMQSKMYTASLNAKAVLRKELESWRGKVFTESELHGFDVEKLVGVNCYLNLVEVMREDKVYVNINSIVKLPAGIQPIRQTGQPIPEWLLKIAEKGRFIAETSKAPIDVPGEDDLPF